MASPSKRRRARSLGSQTLLPVTQRVSGRGAAAGALQTSRRGAGTKGTTKGYKGYKGTKGTTGKAAGASGQAAKVAKKGGPRGPKQASGEAAKAPKRGGARGSKQAAKSTRAVGGSGGRKQCRWLYCKAYDPGTKVTTMCRFFRPPMEQGPGRV